MRSKCFHGPGASRKAPPSPRRAAAGGIRVLITGVHPSANAAGGSGGLVEGVTLQCAKVDLEYKPQKADGSLDTGIHFKYDIKANREG